MEESAIVHTSQQHLHSKHVVDTGESRRGRSPPRGEGLYTFTTSDHDSHSPSTHVDDMLLPPHLNVLKTKAESRAQAETIQCWTVELPVKAANNILMYVISPTLL